MHRQNRWKYLGTAMQSVLPSCWFSLYFLVQKTDISATGKSSLGAAADLQLKPPKQPFAVTVSLLERFD